MGRIVLAVEYCGTRFEGWQTQPHGRTVQDLLERAIERIAGHSVATVCAGRTDTGVHAAVQIVHFDTVVERPITAWVRGCNSHLPADIVVLWAKHVDDDFHARFSAISRRYRYLLVNKPTRPAILSSRVGWFHAPLDIGQMKSAVQNLLGEHDFSAFRAAACQAHSPVRTILDARVERFSEWIVFDFEANAFLHHMIRNLVGALVYVGKGAKPSGWINELLHEKDRRRSAPTFAPDGLYLCGATYSDRWSLPQGGRIIAPLFLPSL